MLFTLMVLSLFQLCMIDKTSSGYVGSCSLLPDLSYGRTFEGDAIEPEHVCQLKSITTQGKEHNQYRKMVMNSETLNTSKVISKRFITKETLKAEFRTWMNFSSFLQCNCHGWSQI